MSDTYVDSLTAVVQALQAEVDDARRAANLALVRASEAEGKCREAERQRDELKDQLRRTRAVLIVLRAAAEDYRIHSELTPFPGESSQAGQAAERDFFRARALTDDILKEEI